MIQVRKALLIALITFFASIWLALFNYERLANLQLRETFPSAEVYAQTQVQSAAEARQLLQQGEKYRKSGNLKAAFHAWKKALKIYQKLNNPQDIGGTLISLGLISREMGNYSAADAYLNQALPIVREIPWPEGEAYALEQFGILYGALWATK